MKKQLLIVFFLFLSYGIQSQVLIALLLGDKLNTGNIEFGLDGGFNYASVSNLDTNDKLSEFNMGFYFDIKIKENWYLNTGVLVKSTLGIDELSMDDLEFLNAKIYLDQNDNILEGDYSQKMSYFLIPALAKYKFNKQIYAEGGLQIGWMYKSWIQFDSNIDGNSARIKENNKDIINWFDMGVAV
ncbi:MAG: outer membrane beta-barrel protein, partial [Flavobacteriaceae bacterium]|nr:outer membrane beta-barrel protein [Flavobacteriaceae bacterium]